jgi:small GTP-binding protein
MEEKREQYNVLLMGQITVGKTTLMERITAVESAKQPALTFGIDFKMQEIKLTDSIVKLTYFDLGNDHITRYLPFVKEIALFLLVFDIDNQASIDFLRKVLAMIPLEDATKILIGNKIDLAADREVSREVAEQFAAQNNMPFIEISAKEGTNIARLQELILAQLRKR